MFPPNKPFHHFSVCSEFLMLEQVYNGGKTKIIHKRGVYFMNEDRLIHGSYGEQRYLHSDEVFRKERNWNINLPSEREFKNGYCIITDKDDTAYSTDELVELLNEFQKENKQLKKEIESWKKHCITHGIAVPITWIDKND